MSYLGYTTPCGKRLMVTRRRYGSTTFTWVDIDMPGDESLSLGDPWPCIVPNREEVLATARLVLAGESGVIADYRAALLAQVEVYRRTAAKRRKAS